jgi:hypothetical protein
MLAIVKPKSRKKPELIVTRGRTEGDTPDWTTLSEAQDTGKCIGYRPDQLWVDVEQQHAGEPRLYGGASQRPKYTLRCPAGGRNH